MPTQILATGTTAANSADVVVASGDTLTVCLKDADGGRALSAALVHILLKDDAGAYMRVDTLTGARPALAIIAPGTYRFSRIAGTSCGVFSA